MMQKDKGSSGKKNKERGHKKSGPQVKVRYSADREFCTAEIIHTADNKNTEKCQYIKDIQPGIKKAEKTIYH